MQLVQLLLSGAALQSLSSDGEQVTQLLLGEVPGGGGRGYSGVNDATSISSIKGWHQARDTQLKADVLW
jgi:hypothetical protein